MTAFKQIIKSTISLSLIFCFLFNDSARTQNFCDSLNYLKYSMGRGDYDFTDSNNIVAVGVFGDVLRSYENGNKWEYTRINLPKSGIYTNLIFTSQKIGYCSTGELVAKTIDGGSSWFPLQIPSSGGGITGLSFINDSIGYIAADRSGLYKTTDGGESFTNILDDSYHQENFSVEQVSFYDAKHGVAAVGHYNKSMFITHDSGKTWIKSVPFELNNLNSFGKIKMIDPLRIYATTSDDEFFKTDDGGQTWLYDNSFAGSHSIPSNLYTVGRDTVYVIANETSSGYWRSIDGGTNWESVFDVDKSFGLIKKNKYSGKVYNFVRQGENSRMIYKGESLEGEWAEERVIGSDGSLINFFSDSTAISISGYNNFIYRTEDEGNSWKKWVPMPDITYSGGITDLRFFDSNNGYFLNDSVVITKDGGKTWKILTVPLQWQKFNKSKIDLQEDSTYFLLSFDGLFKGNRKNTTAKKVIGNYDEATFLLDFAMTNNGVGYAIGVSSLIFKTLDNGEHWSRTDFAIDKQFNNVFFLNADTGFIGTTTNVVYRTTNGGSTWDTTYLLVEPGAEKNFYFTTKYHGYLLSRANGTRTTIYETNDAGKNWTHIKTFPYDIAKFFNFKNWKFVTEDLLTFIKYKTAPAPSYIYGNSQTCSAETTVFKTADVYQGESYNWSFPGATTSSSNVLSGQAKWDIPGKYYINLQVSNECGQSTAKTFEITVKEFVPKIKIIDNKLYCDSAVTYHWYLNDIPLSLEPDSVSTEYLPTSSGLYKVQVENELGCKRFTNNLKFVLTQYVCLGKQVLLDAGTSLYTGVWQVDKGSGYSNISESDTAYVGATNRFLKIKTFTEKAEGYQFRFLNTTSSGEGKSLGEIQLKAGNNWTGLGDNHWENSLNWSCGTVPDEHSFVVIENGTVILSSNATVRGIRISPNVHFSVEQGVVLTIKP